MRNFLLIFLVLSSTSLNAKLLDKILAVIDGNIFSLSQVERIKTTTAPRKLIAPMIYSKSEYSNSEIVELFIQEVMIRKKLEEMGYVIADDQVEAQVKSTEARLGLTRDSLNDFLKSNNLTFNEYFELTRSSIEFNIFLDRVITPLISITEQEIKNEFYKENAEQNKRLAFKYSLVDFSLPKEKVNNEMLTKLPSQLENYKVNGILPAELSSLLSTNTFGDITEEGLRKDLRDLLHNTEEGRFSQPITIDTEVHIFFVSKKDLVESEAYLKEKNRIKAKLQQDSVEKMTSVWYERMKGSHYIKYFL